MLGLHLACLLVRLFGPIGSHSGFNSGVLICSFPQLRVRGFHTGFNSASTACFCLSALFQMHGLIDRMCSVQSVLLKTTAQFGRWQLAHGMFLIDLQRSRVLDTSYFNFPYKVRDSVERDLENRQTLACNRFFSESLN
jgi:hypothetical protein